MPPRQSAYARDHAARIRYLAASSDVTNVYSDKSLEELRAIRDARRQDLENILLAVEQEQQQDRIPGLIHQARLADLVDRVFGSIRQEGEDASKTVLANYRTERQKRKNACEKLGQANAKVKSKDKELEKPNADVKSKDADLGQLRKQLNDQEAKTIAAEKKSADLQHQLDTQKEACKKEKEELRQTHKNASDQIEETHKREMEKLQADQEDVIADYDEEVLLLRETIRDARRRYHPPQQRP